MKYYKKLEQYKAGNMIYDTAKEIAYSYKWYQLAKRINGQMIVNTYGYSPTTIRHISRIRKLFNELDIEYITLEAPKGLQDIEAMKTHYFSKICELSNKITNPHSHKRLRFERECLLNSLQERLNFINEQLN